MLAQSFKPMVLMVLLFYSFVGHGQDEWKPGELEAAFDGIKTGPTLQLLKEKNVTPYKFGIKLQGKGSTAKALKWFEMLVDETIEENEAQAQEYLLGYAFVSWVSGDKAGALEDLDLIRSRSPNTLIKARSDFLLAEIRRGELKIKQALPLYESALSGYQELRHLEGMVKSSRMLATVTLSLGNEEQARHYLGLYEQYFNQAIPAGYKDPKSGQTFELYAELKALNGDFQGAIEFLQKSLEAYYADPDSGNSGLVEAKIGLFTLASGHPSKAHQLVDSIYKKYSKLDDGQVLALNAITAMKLSLCSALEKDAQNHEQSVRDWAASNPKGASYINYLEWAKDDKKFPCPEWR